MNKIFNVDYDVDDETVIKIGDKILNNQFPSLTIREIKCIKRRYVEALHYLENYGRCIYSYHKIYAYARLQTSDLSKRICDHHNGNIVKIHKIIDVLSHYPDTRKIVLTDEIYELVFLAFKASCLLRAIDVLTNGKYLSDYIIGIEKDCAYKLTDIEISLLSDDCFSDYVDNIPLGLLLSMDFDVDSTCLLLQYDIPFKYMTDKQLVQIGMNINFTMYGPNFRNSIIKLEKIIETYIEHPVFSKVKDQIIEDITTSRKLNEDFCKDIISNMSSSMLYK